MCAIMYKESFFSRGCLYFGQNEQVILAPKALKLADFFWDRRTEGHIFSLFLRASLFRQKDRMNRLFSR